MTSLSDRFTTLQPGNILAYSRTIGDADIALFALITGDHHPLHLDHFYAEAAGGHRYAPVALLSGIIEATLAEMVKGYVGTLVFQNLAFPAAAWMDDELTISIVVEALSPQQHEMTCHVSATRTDGAIVVEGTVRQRLEPLNTPLAE